MKVIETYETNLLEFMKEKLLYFWVIEEELVISNKFCFNVRMISYFF